MPTKERLLAMKRAKEKQMENRKRMEIAILFIVVITIMLIIGRISENSTRKLNAKYAGYTYSDCVREIGHEIQY